jgi:hypothetical protein
MTPEQIENLKADFLAWSGGFPPESPEQIEVYVTHSADTNLVETEVRTILTEWMP